MSTSLSDNALDVHPQDALKPLHSGRFFYLRYSSQFITPNKGDKVVILLVLKSLQASRTRNLNILLFYVHKLVLFVLR